MEAVKFIRTIQKMCTKRHCDDCPLSENYRCNVCYTDDPEESVRIVEEWSKEHPEETEKEQKKTIQDNIEGVIYRAISSHKTRIENLEYDVAVIRHNLAELHDKTYALSENVDHTKATEPSKTPEQKRTNKDVLLAVFSDAKIDCDGIPLSCPSSLYESYPCYKFASCNECRHTHWLAEVEE